MEPERAPKINENWSKMSPGALLGRFILHFGRFWSMLKNRCFLVSLQGVQKWIKIGPWSALWPKRVLREFGDGVGYGAAGSPIDQNNDISEQQTTDDPTRLMGRWPGEFSTTARIENTSLKPQNILV